jgi:hypothetical protein
MKISVVQIVAILAGLTFAGIILQAGVAASILALFFQGYVGDPDARSFLPILILTPVALFGGLGVRRGVVAVAHRLGTKRWPPRPQGGTAMTWLLLQASCAAAPILLTTLFASTLLFRQNYGPEAQSIWGAELTPREPTKWEAAQADRADRGRRTKDLRRRLETPSTLTDAELGECAKDFRPLQTATRQRLRLELAKRSIVASLLAEPSRRRVLLSFMDNTGGIAGLSDSDVDAVCEYGASNLAYSWLKECAARAPQPTPDGPRDFLKEIEAMEQSGDAE